MNLNFTKDGEMYVATATVNDDYNVHIELEDAGTVYVRHKTSGDKFALVHINAGITIVDDDYDGIVYPKTIQIISTRPVVNAIITEMK